MSLTIGIEALSLGDPPQGIGAYVLNLVRALSAAPGDMRYIVFLPERARPHLETRVTSQIRFVACPCPGSRWGRFAFQHLAFARSLAREKCDILHATANLVPTGCSMPTVLTVHDLDFLEHPRFSSPARRLVFRLLTPGSLDRARIVVANSNRTAEAIRRFYPNQSQGKVRVIHLGAPDLIPPAESEKRAVLTRHGLDGDYFLCLGSLELRKNIPLVLEAFSLFRRRSGRPLRLVLAGQPGYGHGAIGKALSRSASEGDNILTTGYIPRQDLPALYAGATGLLLLSEAEGFGLPALEAMACGCPVIAADSGALPEICGRAAILVPPGRPETAAAAMARLLDEPGLRSDLAVKGRANLARFSWPEHAEKTKALYALLGSGPARP